MVHVVDCLSDKHKALNSNPSSTKKGNMNNIKLIWSNKMF
jgi:hypothetical protein